MIKWFKNILCDAVKQFDWQWKVGYCSEYKNKKKKEGDNMGYGKPGRQNTPMKRPPNRGNGRGR